MSALGAARAEPGEPGRPFRATGGTRPGRGRMAPEGRGSGSRRSERASCGRQPGSTAGRDGRRRAGSAGRFAVIGRSVGSSSSSSWLGGACGASSMCSEPGRSTAPGRLGLSAGAAAVSSAGAATGAPPTTSSRSYGTWAGRDAATMRLMRVAPDVGRARPPGGGRSDGAAASPAWGCPRSATRRSRRFRRSAASRPAYRRTWAASPAAVPRIRYRMAASWIRRRRRSSVQVSSMSMPDPAGQPVDEVRGRQLRDRDSCRSNRGW